MFVVVVSVLSAVKSCCFVCFEKLNTIRSTCTAYLLSDLICLLLLDAASVKNKPAMPPNKDMAAPQVSGGTTGDATPDAASLLEESGSSLHPPNPRFI